MKKITAILISILIAVSLASCNIIEEVTKLLPTSENTYLNISDVNVLMQEALQRGEETLDFNIAEVSEDDLAHIADNMSTFWGSPKEYLITSIFEDLKGIVPDRTVNVKVVTTTFELSNNYHVYEYIRNGVAIPEGEQKAVEIAKALEGIKTEVFANSDGTDYEDTLAAHDWLVSNLEYDEYIEEFSDDNASYGALVNRKTMCQGYAEALELILRCYTDVNVKQIVGDSQNNIVTGGPTEWIGHAWNLVMIDGQWVHVDATFDDPTGSPEGMVSHYYFAQNDSVMSVDHKWSKEHFPVCEGDSFVYYKRSGLFAYDFETFEEIVTNSVTDTNPVQMEIATEGIKLDEDNIQFIFKANKDIEEIFWSEQEYNGINVIVIEPAYLNDGDEGAE